MLIESVTVYPLHQLRFFLLFGKENWRFLPVFWAILPFVNAFLFLKAPTCTLAEQGETMPISHAF